MTQKTEFRFFTIFQHEEEQEYLRAMHKDGWAFRYVSGLGMYHFAACEPADVVYQLDYNQEGRSHMDEYIQMFADCGWEYLQGFFGYSYFRKAADQMHGKEEIFCDDQSRLLMMQRVFKGRLLPLLVIFSALLIPQFVFNMAESRYVTATFFGLLVGVYLAIFISFAIKYNRFKNRLSK